MSTYAWQNLSFELPAGMHDETVLSFLNDAENPTYNLMVAKDSLDDGIDAFATNVVEELTELEPGFSLIRREKKKVGGKPAFVLHEEIKAEDVTMFQRQALIEMSSTEVVLVSITYTEEHSEDALACFSSVLKSFSF